eukprot:748432-Hanusia_phi.AAC.4
MSASINLLPCTPRLPCCLYKRLFSRRFRNVLCALLLFILAQGSSGAIPTRVVDVDISNAHDGVVDIDLGSGKQSINPPNQGVQPGGEMVDLGSILSLLFGGDIQIPSGGNVIEINLDQAPVQPEPAESFIVFGELENYRHAQIHAGVQADLRREHMLYTL